MPFVVVDTPMCCKNPERYVFATKAAMVADVAPSMVNATRLFLYWFLFSGIWFKNFLRSLPSTYIM